MKTSRALGGRKSSPWICIYIIYILQVIDVFLFSRTIYHRLRIYRCNVLMLAICYFVSAPLGFAQCLRPEMYRKITKASVKGRQRVARIWHPPSRMVVLEECIILQPHWRDAALQIACQWNTSDNDVFMDPLTLPCHSESK